MLKTMTLSEAIAEAFGIKDVPEFTQSKPVKQAREWLDAKKQPYTYTRGVADRGVLVFTRGAGSPQYTVIDKDTDITGGTAVLGTLTPKSKSQQRREDAMNADDASHIQGDDVESTPVISNSPESDADSETTVVNPKPSRRLRRKK